MILGNDETYSEESKREIEQQQSDKNRGKGILREMHMDRSVRVRVKWNMSKQLYKTNVS